MPQCILGSTETLFLEKASKDQMINSCDKGNVDVVINTLIIRRIMWSSSASDCLVEWWERPVMLGRTDECQVHTPLHYTHFLLLPGLVQQPTAGDESLQLLLTSVSLQLPESQLRLFGFILIFENIVLFKHRACLGPCFSCWTSSCKVLWGYLKTCRTGSDVRQ